jgi:hypothetical protein
MLFASVLSSTTSKHLDCQGRDTEIYYVVATALPVSPPISDTIAAYRILATAQDGQNHQQVRPFADAVLLAAADAVANAT